MAQAMRERICCRSFEPVRWRVAKQSAAQTSVAAADDGGEEGSGQLAEFEAGETD